MQKKCFCKTSLLTNTPAIHGGTQTHIHELNRDVNFRSDTEAAGSKQKRRFLQAKNVVVKNIHGSIFLSRIILTTVLWKLAPVCIAERRSQSEVFLQTLTGFTTSMAMWANGVLIFTAITARLPRQILPVRQWEQDG